MGPSLLSLLINPAGGGADLGSSSDSGRDAKGAGGAASWPDDKSPGSLMRASGRQKSASEWREAGASPISYVARLMHGATRSGRHAAYSVEHSGAKPIVDTTGTFDEFDASVDDLLDGPPLEAAGSSFASSRSVARRCRPQRPASPSLLGRSSSQLDLLFPLGDDDAPSSSPFQQQSRTLACL